MEIEMEVKAVEAMVIQKLTQLMNQESVANNKLIIHQLQRALKNLQNFSQQDHISHTYHLQVVYEFENEIDKFAFRVARQKSSKFGFLTKQTLFFNNLNSFRSLTKVCTSPEDGTSLAVWPIPKNPTPKWDFSTQSFDSKLCLLYLTLFPKDFDIRVRRLIRLWVAEGIVERSSEYKFPEDLAQKYFQDFVDRGMIEITKFRSDNNPKKCRLVSVLHDNLLPKAKDIGLFFIKRNLELEDVTGHFGVRRMVQHMVAETGTSHSKSFNVDPSLLRSYVSFNRPRKDTPAKEVGILLERIIKSDFRLLRVLDLEGVNKPTLSDKLGHLRLLTYLGLRRTYLKSLPESVGDLSYLETLDVKHTCLDSLPDSIWKLKQLRHLNLNNIRLAMPPSSSLTLLTLWGLVLDEKISINEGLGKLLDLRELSIKFNLSIKSQGVLLDWVAKLENLQSLRLRSVNGIDPLKLVLKPLENLNKLSNLNLYGNLQRLPDPIEFPPTLKVLTLSISKLSMDPMETLEQLPFLIMLRLLANSFTGERMVCHRGGFKKLQVLKLWMLMELEEWDVEEEAMESLKELEIRCCHKLKYIPCRLLQKQKCMEKLILTGMPDEFVAQTKKRKSKDTTLTIKPCP